MQRARYNRARLNLYEELFDRLIENEYSEAVAANLLVDTRWAEVSRAFVNCLCRRSAAGPIRPLAEDYARLVARAADLAFGTRTHAQIPCWFLQNNETFLASCLDKLFIRFDRNPTAPLQMHRAFANACHRSDPAKKAKADSGPVAPSSRILSASISAKHSEEADE